jgi:hypothetical protein
MYKKDLILAEAEKLALIIANLMGLKTEAESEQFVQVLNETLQENYNVALDDILLYKTEALRQKVEKESYSADKLDALAQLLFLYAEPFLDDEETWLNLNKVLLIYDMLEKKHHRQSFENIHKRNQILQFLNNTYGVEKTRFPLPS